MYGIYNTITIDNVQIIRPSEFELAREDVFAGEYQTCTGEIRADLIGWKYSDITLTWDTLPNDMVSKLMSISGAVSMTFADEDGSHTEQVIRTGFMDMPTRSTLPNGQLVWRNVSISLRFINVHN